MTVGTKIPENGRWVNARSRNGHPYLYWERDVPRLSDDYLDCAVYIYDSPQAAEAGERAGGSGFIVARKFRQNPEFSFPLIVTNRHVVLAAGERPTVRLTDESGKTDIIETMRKDWFLHPNLNDIGVYCGGMSERHRISFVEFERLLTKEMAQRLSIGIGDDVFMVGRFISHDGKQSNMPSVRFGNISIMPRDPIRSEDGTLQESYVVECRSIGGYSGSPVFVYLSAGLARGNIYKMPADIGPWLLGVDWCHLSYLEKVRIRDEHRGNIDQWETQHSGMAGVVPAWFLVELLESAEIMKRFEEQDAKISRDKKAKEAVGGAVLDSAPPSTPFTREEFEGALTKVTRKVESK